MRILVVEDEHKIAAFLRRGLTEEGYAVDLAYDGDEALDWCAVAPYDLIVLDLLLPKRSGIAVCRALRERGAHTPILMLTARDAVEDRVEGLDAGADDYLVKPFAFSELLARIRALLRREPTTQTSLLQVADLTLDPATHIVMRAGAVIPLANKEYQILEYLMRNPNRVLTRTLIAEHVWDYEFDRDSNVIDVHIRTLRRKLDSDHATRVIHTVRGVGYRLTAEGDG
ncbi:MAG: two-component system response regulator RppA [Thermomicrobiales bacterium]